MYNKYIVRKLNRDKRKAILAALVEGCSINTTTRMCGVSKLTVLRLLADVGSLCKDYHDIANRLTGRVQLTTDAHGAYLGAIEGVFGLDIDYAQLQ